MNPSVPLTGWFRSLWLATGRRPFLDALRGSDTPRHEPWCGPAPDLGDTCDCGTADAGIVSERGPEVAVPRGRGSLLDAAPSTEQRTIVEELLDAGTPFSQAVALAPLIADMLASERERLLSSGELWDVAEAHIAKKVAAQRERLAQAYEDKAGWASLHATESVMEAYFNAARIARGGESA